MTDGGLVFVGWITRSHGVRGELKLLEGEGASGAWQTVDELLIGESQGTAVPYRVKKIRAASRFVIVALEGVENRNQSDGLKGQLVFVPREKLPDPDDDSYYASDLLGMQVRDRRGRRLGVLFEIFDNGAHDVYVVKNGPREILIPVVEGVVVEVDCQRREMVIDPPDGLPGL